MKQNITIDQWNEVKLLSPKIPHDMNIGQMMEFIGDAWIGKWYGRWYVNDCKGKRELADALWEAVKHELSEVGE